jgi:exodeoxyribonuclease VII large subunit
MYAKASWYTKNGSLTLSAREIRQVGIGELMARLEELKTLLASEGLFALERKVALPLLPKKIGLICGRNTDAEKDVVENAKRRWPSVEFEIREVTVQGAAAVVEVSAALSELEAMADVDVIIITRGGGSFEDLLPFSDESLIRVVASVNTPVVAAIGHEEDRPLIDYVADYRASTPTDAARKIVPDVLQEIADLRNSWARIQTLVSTNLSRLKQELELTKNRPALASPATLIEQRLKDNNAARTAIYVQVMNFLKLESAHVKGASATLRALSPQGTLERGFAIVRSKAGEIVRTVSSVPAGTTVKIRFADGETSAEISAD